MYVKKNYIEDNYLIIFWIFKVLFYVIILFKRNFEMKCYKKW